MPGSTGRVALDVGALHVLTSTDLRYGLATKTRVPMRGEAAYDRALSFSATAAAHAAGASRAEACDAAVRAVRADRVEAQSSFRVRAGWYGSGRDGGGGRRPHGIAAGGGRGR